VKFIIYFYLIIFLSVFNKANAADYLKANLKFKAEIVDHSCIISSDSQNMEVKLGTWDTKRFKSPNSISTPTHFVINLEDCDADNINFKFSGSSTNSGYLSLDNNSLATNLAVKLSNNDGSILKINEFSPPIINTSKNNLSVGFYANYISENGEATPGSAIATATFEINYD
jgi:type 1 fimbria pilin